jgi:plasmid stabilization system protein ParE
MKYEFHPEAEQEFLEAAARYEAEVPGLGEQFGTEVFRVVELLLVDPEIGSHIEGELRHFVLRRFPYSVIYARASEVLYVLAVAHGHRKPGYWATQRSR